ncbi:MAG TPA: MerR family transcriptional regulator [Solirubrobacteraceae bacterium]|jgi:DNA-binding transcriptional MerR regulator
MSDDLRQLTIGEVSAAASMSASRIRYYESRGVLPEPERASGKRRYSRDVLRRLAIIDAAQRVGFTLDEIADLLGSGDGTAHERLRTLVRLKLPDIEALIERATAVRDLLEVCSTCDCETIDVCRLLDEGATV